MYPPIYRSFGVILPAGVSPHDGRGAIAPAGGLNDLPSPPEMLLCLRLALLGVVAIQEYVVVVLLMGLVDI